MNKIKNLSLVLLSVASISILFTSCAKEEILGCTDPIAINYDEYSETDDGSCQYSGEIVFWYGSTTRDFLAAEGVIDLTFKMDGVISGSQPTTWSWPQAPNCGENASATVSVDMGSNTTKTVSIKLMTNDGSGTLESYNSKTVEMNAGECQKFEVTVNTLVEMFTE